MEQWWNSSDVTHLSGKREEDRVGEDDDEEEGEKDGRVSRGSEEEVEGTVGEEMEVGEGGDDEDYEREAPPPSDINDCDWDGLSESFMT